MHLTITRIEIEEREGRGDVDCVFQEELTTSCASISSTNCNHSIVNASHKSHKI